MGILPHLQQMGFTYFITATRRFNRKEPFNRVLSQRNILNFIWDCLLHAINGTCLFVASRCFEFRGFIYSLYCCCCCWFYVCHFFYFVGLSQKKNPMQLQRNAATMVWFFFHLKLPTDIALQCNKQFVVL